jgi:hypothetical protein
MVNKIKTILKTFWFVIKVTIPIIPLIMAFIYFPDIIDNLLGNDTHNCSSSPYNIYTNETGGRYFFGKCYVPVTEIYESTEKCGLFGVNCRDTTPHYDSFRHGVCFKLKTGERC